MCDQKFCLWIHIPALWKDKSGLMLKKKNSLKPNEYTFITKYYVYYKNLLML